jgi:hypothetical protein
MLVTAPICAYRVPLTRLVPLIRIDVRRSIVPATVRVKPNTPSLVVYQANSHTMLPPDW